MDTNTSTRYSSFARSNVTRPRPILVILDHGDTAWLAHVSLYEPPAVGRRFWHRGLEWRISRLRTLARTFVAEPVGA